MHWLNVKTFRKIWKRVSKNPFKKRFRFVSVSFFFRFRFVFVNKKTNKQTNAVTTVRIVLQTDTCVRSFFRKGTLPHMFSYFWCLFNLYFDYCSKCKHFDNFGYYSYNHFLQSHLQTLGYKPPAFYHRQHCGAKIVSDRIQDKWILSNIVIVSYLSLELVDNINIQRHISELTVIHTCCEYLHTYWNLTRPVAPNTRKRCGKPVILIYVARYSAPMVRW